MGKDHLLQSIFAQSSPPNTLGSMQIQFDERGDMLVLPELMSLSGVHKRSVAQKWKPMYAFMKTFVTQRADFANTWYMMPAEPPLASLLGLIFAELICSTYTTE